MRLIDSIDLYSAQSLGAITALMFDSPPADPTKFKECGSLEHDPATIHSLHPVLNTVLGDLVNFFDASRPLLPYSSQQQYSSELSVGPTLM